MRGVLVDAVIMVAKRQKIRLVFVEKIQALHVVIGNSERFFLLARTTAQWREIPKVAKVDAVLRLPGLAECQQDFFRLVAD